MNLANFFQSCITSLDQELFKKGAESDGAHNDAYCAFCFVKGILKEQGIGRLKRWK